MFMIGSPDRPLYYRETPASFFTSDNRDFFILFVELVRSSEEKTVRNYLKGQYYKLEDATPEDRKKAEETIRNNNYRFICLEIVRMLDLNLDNQEVIDLCSQETMSYETIVDLVEQHFVKKQYRQS